MPDEPSPLETANIQPQSIPYSERGLQRLKAQAEGFSQAKKHLSALMEQTPVPDGVFLEAMHLMGRGLQLRKDYLAHIDHYHETEWLLDPKKAPKTLDHQLYAEMHPPIIQAIGYDLTFFLVKPAITEWYYMAPVIWFSDLACEVTPDALKHSSITQELMGSLRMLFLFAAHLDNNDGSLELYTAQLTSLLGKLAYSTHYDCHQTLQPLQSQHGFDLAEFENMLHRASDHMMNIGFSGRPDHQHIYLYDTLKFCRHLMQPNCTAELIRHFCNTPPTTPIEIANGVNLLAELVQSYRLFFTQPGALPDSHLPLIQQLLSLNSVDWLQGLFKATADPAIAHLLQQIQQLSALAPPQLTCWQPLTLPSAITPKAMKPVTPTIIPPVGCSVTATPLAKAIKELPAFASKVGPRLIQGDRVSNISPAELTTLNKTLTPLDKTALQLLEETGSEYQQAVQFFKNKDAKANAWIERVTELASQFEDFLQQNKKTLTLIQSFSVEKKYSQTERHLIHMLASINQCLFNFYQGQYEATLEKFIVRCKAQGGLALSSQHPSDAQKYLNDLTTGLTDLQNQYIRVLVHRVQLAVCHHRLRTVDSQNFNFFPELCRSYFVCVDTCVEALDNLECTKPPVPACPPQAEAKLLEQLKTNRKKALIAVRKALFNGPIAQNSHFLFTFGFQYYPESSRYKTDELLAMKAIFNPGQLPEILEKLDRITPAVQLSLPEARQLMRTVVEQINQHAAKLRNQDVPTREGHLASLDCIARSFYHGWLREQSESLKLQSESGIAAEHDISEAFKVLEETIEYRRAEHDIEKKKQALKAKKRQVYLEATPKKKNQKTSASKGQKPEPEPDGQSEHSGSDSRSTSPVLQAVATAKPEPQPVDKAQQALDEAVALIKNRPAQALEKLEEVIIRHGDNLDICFHAQIRRADATIKMLKPHLEKMQLLHSDLNRFTLLLNKAISTPPHQFGDNDLFNKIANELFKPLPDYLVKLAELLKQYSDAIAMVQRLDNGMCSDEVMDSALVTLEDSKKVSLTIKTVLKMCTPAIEASQLKIQFSAIKKQFYMANPELAPAKHKKSKKPQADVFKDASTKLKEMESLLRTADLSSPLLT